MKNYTITVNGNVYNVTIEEGASAAPAAAPAPAPAPAAPAGAQGAIKVEAPMIGKILAVKVKPGQAVKRGEPVVVLEAMKMENEIVAPQDGVIATIDCKEGDQVESGAVLATLN